MPHRLSLISHPLTVAGLGPRTESLVLTGNGWELLRGTIDGFAPVEERDVALGQHAGPAS